MQPLLDAIENERHVAVVRILNKEFQVVLNSMIAACTKREAMLSTDSVQENFSAILFEGEETPGTPAVLETFGLGQEPGR